MLLNKFRSVLSVHSVNCEFCTARIVAVVSVLRQSFCPSDRLTMAPPLNRNPLRRTLEYTLIHREVPKPIEEQRRALNKQIKGRLTVGSIQWSANGQRGLWQFTAPLFTPRTTKRGDSAFHFAAECNLPTTTVFCSTWLNTVCGVKINLMWTFLSVQRARDIYGNF